jgi:hypothetical protein
VVSLVWCGVVVDGGPYLTCGTGMDRCHTRRGACWHRGQRTQKRAAITTINPFDRKHHLQQAIPVQPPTSIHPRPIHRKLSTPVPHRRPPRPTRPRPRRNTDIFNTCIDAESSIPERIAKPVAQLGLLLAPSRVCVMAWFTFDVDLRVASFFFSLHIAGSYILSAMDSLSLPLQFLRK